MRWTGGSKRQARLAPTCETAIAEGLAKGGVVVAIVRAWKV